MKKNDWMLVLLGVAIAVGLINFLFMFAHWHQQKQARRMNSLFSAPINATPLAMPGMTGMVKGNNPQSFFGLVDSLLNTSFPGVAGSGGFTAAQPVPVPKSQVAKSNYTTDLNIEDNPAEYVITADLGADAGGTVNVAVQDDNLVISGHHKTDALAANGYDYQESSFQKIIPLSAPVDVGRMTQKKQGRTLEITIPKKLRH